jgi:hypothetical protein
MNDLLWTAGLYFPPGDKSLRSEHGSCELQNDKKELWQQQQQQLYQQEHLIGGCQLRQFLTLYYTLSRLTCWSNCMDLQFIATNTACNIKISPVHADLILL